MTALPTLFLSHGSPLHAVRAGAAGRAWVEIARALPKPKAILIASAHWETSLPLLTGSRAPQTMHDFGGFPPELYALRYPAPGAPESLRSPVAGPTPSAACAQAVTSDSASSCVCCP